MPIRKENKARYPQDWPAIRAAILLRAGNRCEGSRAYPGCRAQNGQRHPVTGSRVVLTVSHYPDPDPENCAPGNLAARCQRCHLALDRSQHVQNRRRSRYGKHAGQASLPEDGG